MALGLGSVSGALLKLLALRTRLTLPGSGECVVAFLAACGVPAPGVQLRRDRPN